MEGEREMTYDYSTHLPLIQVEPSALLEIFEAGIREVFRLSCSSES